MMATRRQDTLLSTRLSSWRILGWPCCVGCMGSGFRQLSVAI